MSEPSSLPVFDYAQVLPPLGFHFPARMTVLPLGGGRIALVSPIPIDAHIANELAALGEVAYLIAPCLLHHLYLADAVKRYPNARVIAPRGFAKKLPDQRIDFELEEQLPEPLTQAVDVRFVAGAPGLDEFVFFHRATRTLLVTDLVFNIVAPRGFVAHLVLFMTGTHKRLASSRALRVMVKDRARCAASVAQILTLPFETLVMAHGEIVRDDAQAKLAQALSWLSPRQRALPAST
jgi:hypothetical protein